MLRQRRRFKPRFTGMGQFPSQSEFPLPASSQFSLHTEHKPIIEKTREMEKLKKKTVPFSFWNWVIASIIFRLILIYFPKNLNLSSRPEVSTPLTSFRRRTLPFLSYKINFPLPFLQLLFNLIFFFWVQLLKVTG